MIEERVGDTSLHRSFTWIGHGGMAPEMTGPFPTAGERHRESSNSASSVPYLHMFWFSSASVKEPICYEQLILL